jgi:ATP-binding cassette subfamily F protein uup
MPLLSLHNVSIAFGLHNLLENVGFQIDPGERVCLIGRNGAGKSTFLKMIDGEIQPDTGEIWHKPGLRIGRLTQDLPLSRDRTVFEWVASGLDNLGRLLSAYHEAAVQVALAPSPDRLRRMEHLQHDLEAQEGWRLNQRIETTLTRFSLPADERLSALSGGWLRRAALGRVLVSDPELLLLDEPTNHLDIEAIEWLEEQLLAYQGALLFVTHDRALLRRLATRIVELDRGQLTSWPGDYAKFLQKKAAALEAEARQQAKFDKKLAQEEVWIRQGIQARRTRNEGRVRALAALREERRARREATGTASFRLMEADTSGKRVIEAEHVGYAWQENPLIQDFSIRILRGDRIGLIGPNGCGKTTLLNLLLGRLNPQTGRIRLGTRLQVAYFDQRRSQLDPESTVMNNVAEGRETITVNGQSRHIIGYLGDFLFTPERVRSPVKSLSGGERNRLLLARLFSQPANLLVMDEPTNDLDIETLELLEERLLDYEGTLLLVSHDRAFLDHVVTSCLVFEGQGRIREYIGGYGDWLRQRQSSETSPRKSDFKPARPKPSKPRTQGKLSYKDQRELEQLPERIEALETEQNQLSTMTADPEFYRQDTTEINRILDRLKVLEKDLEAAYNRWDELESITFSES